MGAVLPKMLTANRLSDGEVVYWTSHGSWSIDLWDGVVLASAEAEAQAEAAGQLAEAERILVGAYLMDVRIQDGRTVPVKMRELIRASGPSVRLDLGKQAER